MEAKTSQSAFTGARQLHMLMWSDACGGQRLASVSSSVTHHLIYGDRVSVSPVQIDQLDKELQVSSHLCLPSAAVPEACWESELGPLLVQ